MASPKWRAAGNEENMLPWLGPNNERARPESIPGSAEYLNDLVDSSGRCKHVAANMISARAENPTKIPKYLGFFTDAATQDASKIEYDKQMTSEVQHLEPVFHQTEGPLRHPITKLDTEKICLACFEKAAPKGFATWSLEYNNKTKRYGTLPPQINAGEAVSAERYLDDRPHFFASVAARPIFAQMAHDRMPFYVDTLHAPPWDPNINDNTEEGKRKMKEQSDRINKANGPAYEGAAVVWRADGSFGYGQNSTAEHRVAHHRGTLRNPPYRPDNSSEPYAPPVKANRGVYPRSPKPYRAPPAPRDPRYLPMTEFLAGLPEEVRRELNDLGDNGDGRWPEPIPRRPLTLTRVDSKEKLLTGRSDPSAPSNEETSRWQLEKKQREVYQERHTKMTRDERLRRYNQIMIDNGYPSEYLPRSSPTTQDDYDNMHNRFDPEPDRIPYKYETRPMDSISEISDRLVAGRPLDRSYLRNLPHLSDTGIITSTADSRHSREVSRSNSSHISGSLQFQAPEGPSQSSISNDSITSSRVSSRRQASSSINAGSEVRQPLPPRSGSTAQIASSQSRVISQTDHVASLQRQPPTRTLASNQDSISNTDYNRPQSTLGAPNYNPKSHDSNRHSQDKEPVHASSLPSVPEGSMTRPSQSRGITNQKNMEVRGSTTIPTSARTSASSQYSSRATSQLLNGSASPKDTGRRQYQANTRSNVPTQPSSRPGNSSRETLQPSKESASPRDINRREYQADTRSNTPSQLSATPGRSSRGISQPSRDSTNRSDITMSRTTEYRGDNSSRVGNGENLVSRQNIFSGRTSNDPSDRASDLQPPSDDQSRYSRSTR